MYFGGMLLSLLLSCDVRVSHKPASLEIEAVSVCNTKPKGLKNSMKSSVVISFINEEQEEVGKASGNYFKYRGNNFILTAAHVVQVPENVDLIVKERWGVDSSTVKVVYVDHDNDLAVLLLNRELSTVKPLKWRSKSTWDINVGEDLYYTGHPMDMDHLTLRGSVSKVSPYSIVMQGFAYMGASGSAVFDRRGRVVGVVSAIKFDLAGNMFPQLIPTMVLIGPLGQLNNEMLNELLRK